MPVIYAKSVAGKRLRRCSRTRLTGSNFIDYHAAIQHDFRKTTKSAVRPAHPSRNLPDPAMLRR
jgi:hypothetical protein